MQFEESRQVGKWQLQRKHFLNICNAWFANQHATTPGVTLITLKRRPFADEALDLLEDNATDFL